MAGRFGRIAAALVIGAGSLWAGDVHAQFYRGKTITMIINYPAGGPSDIEGRIMTQFLPAHIPGKPTIVVKNVAGGGGLIGTNFLGEVAKPDGETFGFFTWSPLAELLSDPALRFKFSEFAVVAGVENPLVAYARKDTPPGLKTAADIMRAKGFRTLSLDVGSTNTVNMTLAFQLLGVPIKPVYGYKGLKEVETGILQNEGQAANTSLPGWSASIEPTMGKQGIVIPLWQLAAPGKDGSYPRNSRIKDIPTFEEFYQQAKGAKPSGIAYEALRATVDTQTAMFRGMFMHPKSPKEAITTMQAAFVSLWKDAKFLETYSKVVKNEPELVTGDQAAAAMAKLGTIKPEVKTYIDDHIKSLSAK